jgi:hypothetical protein
VSDYEAKQVIERMKKKLADNGYTEDSDGHWHWRDGFLAAYSASFPSIDSAHRHCEEQEYFEALREFVDRIASPESIESVLFGDYFGAMEKIEIWQAEAKRLRGKE